MSEFNRLSQKIGTAIHRIVRESKSKDRLSSRDIAYLISSEEPVLDAMAELIEHTIKMEKENG